MSLPSKKGTAKPLNPASKPSIPSLPQGSSHPILPHLAELSDIHKTFHLAHHRNKNQHRVAKWWKPFCVLRRHLGRLVEAGHEVSSLATMGDEFALSGKKAIAAQRRAGTSRFTEKMSNAEKDVNARAGFMKEFVVGKCYSGFASLVADPQYAPLGLMLLASLARLNSLLGAVGETEVDIEETGQTDAMNVGAEEDLGEVVTRGQVKSNETVDAVEPIERPEHDTQQETEDSEIVREEVKERKKDKKKREEKAERQKLKRPAEESMESSSKTLKKKKKKKKGDEFDDLFSGLL